MVCELPGRGEPLHSRAPGLHLCEARVRRKPSEGYHASGQQLRRRQRGGGQGWQGCSESLCGGGGAGAARARIGTARSGSFGAGGSSGAVEGFGGRKSAWIVGAGGGEGRGCGGLSLAWRTCKGERVATGNMCGALCLDLKTWRHACSQASVTVKGSRGALSLFLRSPLQY